MGEGATLTRAFRCVLMDPEWEKSREDQAIARIHRCGQKQNTQAYRLICSDGADGVIVKRHAGVQALNVGAQQVQSGELRESGNQYTYPGEDEIDENDEANDEKKSDENESDDGKQPFKTPFFNPNYWNQFPPSGSQ